MISGIKNIILDIDGVMTDGTKTYGQDGEVLSKRYADQDFTATSRIRTSVGLPYRRSAVARGSGPGRPCRETLPAKGAFAGSLRSPRSS